MSSVVVSVLEVDVEVALAEPDVVSESWLLAVGVSVCLVLCMEAFIVRLIISVAISMVFSMTR